MLTPDELKPAGSGRALLALVLAAVLACCSLYYFSQKSIAVYNAGNFDLQLFVQAAIRHLQDKPVYERADDLADRYKPGAMVFKFPPPYLFHFIPWFDASGKQSGTFRPLFSLAYVFIYAVTVLLACRLVLQCRGTTLKQTDYSSTTFLLLAVSFASFFIPFFLVLGGTSGEGYILAVAVLAFACLRRFPWFSGFLFAWLACLKLYPVFLLLYPLLCRQWRVLFAAAASFILIALASLSVFGIGENLFYVQKILPILLTEEVSADWSELFLHTTGNQGIVKLLVSYELLPNRLPFWVNTVRLPFVAAMLYLFLKFPVRHDEREWQSLVAFALVILTMLICLPNVFFAYFILLLFPMLVVAGYLWTQEKHGWLVFLVAAMCCFLIDDNWTYSLGSHSGFFYPTEAIVKEYHALGHYAYMWRNHRLLIVLQSLANITPFLPYLLWFFTAAVLWGASSRASRKAL